jgi:hypothetical protein
MISVKDVLFIAFGFASFAVYALSTGYIRSRLLEVGVALKRWSG